MPSPRILLAVTADVSVGFVAGMATHLAGRGWDVHVASAAGPRLSALGSEPGVTAHALTMDRDPSPWSDARALLSAVRLVRSLRPDVLSVATPKAGLLFSLAGVLTRVPVRVYQLWGLRYETAAGAGRCVLRALEKVATAAATHVLAVSESLRATAVHDRVVPAHKVRVLGAGSSHGVDVARFTVDPADRRLRQRRRWAGQDDVPVIGYVGRLHPDKGIDTLSGAARLLADQGVRARLVLVGGMDGADPHLLKSIAGSGWPVELWGHVDDVAEPLAHFDLLCLPTRREGFPNVVLEAAAAGLPTVATRATGVVDAVLHEQTGLVAASHNPARLAHEIRRLLHDDALRATLGAAARERTERLFDQEIVWDAYAGFYESALAQASAGRG